VSRIPKTEEWLARYKMSFIIGQKHGKACQKHNHTHAKIANAWKQRSLNMWVKSLKIIWVHYMIYEHVFKRLIFHNNNFFNVLPTYFTKTTHLSHLLKGTHFLLFSIIHLKNHYHDAFKNNLGYIWTSSKNEFHFIFLQKNMF